MVQSFFVCVEEVPDCFISFEMTRYAETFSKILRLKAQNDSNSLSTKVDPTSAWCAPDCHVLTTFVLVMTRERMN